MAEVPPFILIASIFATLSISLAFAVPDTPFVLAHKKAIIAKLRPNDERVSVTVDIYNCGPVTAYDLSLADDAWSSDVFDLVTGNTSKSWKTLDSGSHVSHSFELVPKRKTVYFGAPALIKFRVPLNSRLQEALSTPISPIQTLADEIKIDRLQLAQKLLAKYSSHISVILIVGAIAHFVFFPPKPVARNGKKKKH